ncbi:MAG: polysaccharide deacetylase family protein [Muribaculaceae bacterium]|nr:polysaccharide deacetylase family protein [Muribaculaceae bacterium]
MIERPPLLFRIFFPEALFRLGRRERCVFITFDDGPIPEITPWVLDVLDRYGVKATFFMVGDNARRHPELVEEVLARGHAIGNHTMHHLKGASTSTERYMADVREAEKHIDSHLFRPPHGLLRWKQAALIKKDYTLIMYDLITRDYSRHLTAAEVVGNVRHYTRPGSIIVFHDSLKSWPRLKDALAPSLEWLIGQGYEFRRLSRPGENFHHHHHHHR